MNGCFKRHSIILYLEHPLAGSIIISIIIIIFTKLIFYPNFHSNLFMLDN